MTKANAVTREKACGCLHESLDGGWWCSRSGTYYTYKPCTGCKYNEKESKTMTATTTKTQVRCKVQEGDTTRRIVTHSKGSWKWQDAYCVATYEARPDQEGRLRWYSIEHGPKYSRPQLDRMGITDELQDGSIHRRLVSEIAG